MGTEVSSVYATLLYLKPTAAVSFTKSPKLVPFTLLYTRRERTKTEKNNLKFESQHSFEQILGISSSQARVTLKRRHVS